MKSLLFLSLITPLPAQDHFRDCPPDTFRTILHYCAEFGIPLDIAIELAWNESRFDPSAIGYNAHSQDYGLFQLNSHDMEKFCQVYNNGAAFDPLDAEVNARIGLHYLRDLWRENGTWRKALEVWNCGSCKTVPRDTKEFVNRILEEK